MTDNNTISDERKNRPNLVFINLDQLSAINTLSSNGCQYVDTPNIDKLMESGISFERSYSADPVCCPARTSWWTGLYSSEHGVVINNIPCHQDLPDLGPYLEENGYNVFYSGKWHAPGLSVRESFHVLHEGSWWGEITDSDVTRSAKSFLRSYQEDKPFFLALGYLNPHDICLTWHQYQGEKVPQPIADGILEPEDLPPLPVQDYAEKELEIFKRKHRSDQRLANYTDLQWRYYLYKYYRHIEMVDKEIGVVLDEIERAPFCDETIIIFTSDHGDGMGYHKTSSKMFLYDEVVRIPFVIATLGNKLPVSKGQRDSDHLISGVDFLPTVCDYAGIEPLVDRGLSLKPIAEGKELKQWRDYVYAETAVYSRMISTQNYKYIMEYKIKDDENVDEVVSPPRHSTHEIGVEQLIDLKNDPGETMNLAYDEDKQQLIEEFRKRLFAQENKLDNRSFGNNWPQIRKWRD